MGQKHSTHPEINGWELIVCLWDPYCSQNKLLLVFSKKKKSTQAGPRKHSKIDKMGPS